MAEIWFKQAKYCLSIHKSAEISPCEIQSLLDYDRSQCAESSYLKTMNNVRIFGVMR